MKNRLYILLIAAAGVITISGPMFAHHGVADLDMTKTVTIKGEVTDFQFTNPHVLIYMNVKDDKGNIKKWTVEVVSPNSLSRRGWTKDSFKPGDQITVTGNPKKNSSQALRLNSAILPNGQELSTGDDNRY